MAATTRITFYFGLKRPEQPAVRAFYAVESPGSASYRRFLTPSEISKRYGANATTRRAFVRAVRRLGLSAQVDRSGVFARVAGTVAQLERVFAVRIKTMYSDDVHATSYFVPGGVLHLPRALRPLVVEVVPDYARSSPPPQPPKAAGALAKPRPPVALPQRPDSFSISYGYCESQILGPRAPRDSRQGARLLNSLFVRLGLAGVGVFASAGDFGSSCNGERRLGAPGPHRPRL